MKDTLDTPLAVVNAFNDWHDEVVAILDSAMINTLCPITEGTLADVINIIEEKPFIIDISVNEEALLDEDEIDRF